MKKIVIITALIAFIPFSAFSQLSLAIKSTSQSTYHYNENIEKVMEASAVNIVYLVVTEEKNTVELKTDDRSIIEKFILVQPKNYLGSEKEMSYEMVTADGSVLTLEIDINNGHFTIAPKAIQQGSVVKHYYFDK
jgi:hypothetical protein